MGAAESVVTSGFARFLENVRATLKAPEIEETLDVYFYRPVGYVIARMGYAIGVSPNTVTASGVLLGLLGSHYFMHTSLAANMWGMMLLVVAESFDAADGQLARMTGRFSAFGRILDGVGSNVIFVSIYVHLWIRLTATFGRLWPTVAILAAGISHSLQCAVADYYRNAFLMAVYGEGEQESSTAVTARYAALSWRTSPGAKLLTRFYLNYVREQEMLARGFQALQRAAGSFGRPWPAWIGDAYRAVNQRLIKYYNILTSNTRMIALGVALFLGRPWLYLAFEIVVLNGLLVVVLWRQNRHDLALAARVREAAVRAVAATA
jgi:phosphatidylglycerophosphate synthase